MEHSTYSLILRLRSNCCWRTWQNKFTFPLHVDNNRQLRRSFLNCVVLMQHVSAQEEATKRLIRQKRNYYVSFIIILHHPKLRSRS